MYLLHFTNAHINKLPVQTDLGKQTAQINPYNLTSDVTTAGKGETLDMTGYPSTTAKYWWKCYVKSTTYNTTAFVKRVVSSIEFVPHDLVQFILRFSYGNVWEESSRI